MTPYRYVVHLRLQRALELMRDGRAWLKSRLPQPSPTRALSRWVRWVHGVSPTELTAR
jgi:AraC family transcriptional regulator